MNSYYFSLFGVRADGPSRVAEGDVYGSEALLFVVPDVGFANALKALVAAARDNDLEIDRVVSAGSPKAFEPEVFPFPHDFKTMMEDAKNSGEICARDGDIYGPLTDKLSGVTLGFADIYDPSRLVDGHPYEGEIVAFAIKAAPHIALEGLALRCETENLTLKGIDDMADAVFGDPDVLREILAIDGNKFSLTRGQLCWGISHTYERETEGEQRPLN